MASKQRATFHSGNVELDLASNGLLVATASGVLTPDVLRGLARAGLALPFAVALVDYRRAVVAVSEADLFRVMPPSGGRPLAIVVTSEQAPVFTKHAWECAQAGAVRRLFVDDPVGAMSWSRRQAELRQQEMLMQTRRQLALARAAA